MPAFISLLVKHTYVTFSAQSQQNVQHFGFNLCFTPVSAEIVYMLEFADCAKRMDMPAQPAHEMKVEFIASSSKVTPHWNPDV